MPVRWCIATCATVVIAGCAGAAPAALLHGTPALYLLKVDQLVAPDFSLDSSAHAVDAVDIAGGDSAAAQQLVADGFVAAAREDFFRAVASLAVVNGPVQIGDTVEEFSSVAGTASAYGGDVTRLDAAPGSTAVSTGALGDAAHASTRTATSSTGVLVVEITFEWRIDNLLDTLVVRGRDGGIRPDDALLLAHRQTATELGLATPVARSG